MPLLRDDLADLQPYRRPAAERDPAGLARLHMNEAAEDWPADAREALLARLRALPFRFYPERQAELTERLRRRLGAPEGGLLLGPSSGALLDLLALAGLDPGDAVAVPEPGFSLHPLLLRRHRARPRPVPVGLGFPLDPWFQALEEGVRQLWLTLPNNPTGAWVGPEELEPLLAAAAARPDPPLVVLDEAYGDFAPASHRLAVDRWPNTVLLRTFSKALASASWRLGYLLGDPALVSRLAALQLPYGMSAASLEALDVALDFPGAFDGAVRRTVALRERLAGALGGPASAANFLWLEPDPSPALRAAGQLVRSLPGRDAARVTVGDGAQCAATAAALGSALPPPAAGSGRRLLVLDIDGVLIEADRSFMEAVALAVAERFPQAPWTDAHFTAFKRAGGFNNDFRLTAGAWALAESGGVDGILEGRDLAPLAGRIEALEPGAKAVVQRHYADTVKYERPLVDLAELRALPCDLAVLTGRPPEELVLAWKVLGWSLPGLPDAGPHLRKPSPAGLLQLADAFRAGAVTFVGDTRDDAACLAAAREARPGLDWRFAAVGPDRDRFAREGDLCAPTLRALLPTLAQEA